MRFMDPGRSRPARLVAVGAAILLGGAHPRAAQGACDVALGGLVQVGEGQIFDLELRVLADCDSFNAYETRIQFDPSRLQFIPLPQPQQEGELMTGACPARFHQFSESSGTITLTHALLCAGAQVSGPGVLYRLRFQALSGPTVTHVLLPELALAVAGSPLPEPTLSNAVVQIGTLTGLPDGDSGAPGPRLTAFPNPSRAAVNLGLVAAASGPARLEILSVDGRRIFTVFSGDVEAGTTYQFRWDGRDAWGTPVAPGIYYQRVRVGGSTAALPLVRLN